MVVKELGKIPELVLIEPGAVLDFAKRYANLCDKLHSDINDSLLLQLIIDAGITRLFSYDKQLTSKAKELGIKAIV